MNIPLRTTAGPTASVLADRPSVEALVPAWRELLADSASDEPTLSTGHIDDRKESWRMSAAERGGNWLGSMICFSVLLAGSHS